MRYPGDCSARSSSLAAFRSVSISRRWDARSLSSVSRPARCSWSSVLTGVQNSASPEFHQGFMLSPVADRYRWLAEHEGRHHVMETDSHYAADRFHRPEDTASETADHATSLPRSRSGMHC